MSLPSAQQAAAPTDGDASVPLLPLTNEPEPPAAPAASSDITMSG
jgi:hypothetical protein